MNDNNSNSNSNNNNNNNNTHNNTRTSMTTTNHNNSSGSIIESPSVYNYTIFWDDIDYISSRVSKIAILGGLVGGIHGMYKGHLLRRTSFLVAVSCATAATSCFMTERIAFRLIQQYNQYNYNSSSSSSSENSNSNYNRNSSISESTKFPVTSSIVVPTTTTTSVKAVKEDTEEDTEEDSWGHLFLSHLMGGMIGGSMNGSLYIRKPIQGMFFLTPMMILIGWIEYNFQDLREQRKKEIYHNNNNNNTSSIKQQ